MMASLRLLLSNNSAPKSSLKIPPKHRVMFCPRLFPSFVHIVPPLPYFLTLDCYARHALSHFFVYCVLTAMAAAVFAPVFPRTLSPPEKNPHTPQFDNRFKWFRSFHHQAGLHVKRWRGMLEPSLGTRRTGRLHIGTQSLHLQACIDMNKVMEVARADDVTGNPFSVAITAPDRVHFVKGTCKEESAWWLEVLQIFPRSSIKTGRAKRCHL